MNWSESTILFKYTSKSRPENFERGLKSIIDNLHSVRDAVVLVSLDSDDERLPEYEEVIKRYFDKITIRQFNGKSTSKINAINRDINNVKIEWDILVNMSDDMVFTMANFDNVIRGLFAQHFPDGDGFLHCLDEAKGANVSTLSIMDRQYYNRDKYVYHPDFISTWADNYATEQAKRRNRYAYSSVVMFEHLHPNWHKAMMDKQYVNQLDYRIDNGDKQTYYKLSGLEITD